MKSRIGEKSGKKRIGKAYIVTFGVIFVLIGVAVLRSGILPLRSVEVAFSDIAPNGLAIVPASCASPAPPYSQLIGTKYVGYKVPPGTNQADIYVASVPMEFCISNTSSNTYFFPVGSYVDATAFLTAAFDKLTVPGLSSTKYATAGIIGDYKVSCAANGVDGWAVDAALLGQPLDISISIDGVERASVANNIDRPGLGAAAGLGAGNDTHGFVWTIPAAFQNGVQHTLAIMGLDIQNLQSAALFGPTTFTCP